MYQPHHESGQEVLCVFEFVFEFLFEYAIDCPHHEGAKFIPKCHYEENSRSPLKSRTRNMNF
jgi:hypothetical protein